MTDDAAGLSDPPDVSGLVMGLLALVVGLIAGCGAIVFRAMIGLFHNLLFLGDLSWSYDANVHTPASPWGYLVILVPVVGAIGVAFIVGTFAPEAKGHGVPEVMEAIYYRDGRIRPVVALAKSIASALSIGSGGSVGREGPIAQIGAAFGSTLGQIVRMPAHQRIVLVAAGAGAGIAATFNAPMGGILFAVELMLPAMTARSIFSVALAIIVATRIGRAFFGTLPSFDVSSLVVPGPDGPAITLPWFLLCGLAIGLFATLMVRAIYWFEDRFDALPGNYYTRHVLGMLAVGVIMLGFMVLSGPVLGQPGHYYVQGVGYATILDILRADLTASGFLLLLAGAKLLVTGLTLGSGASGGVFSPALFMGATLGACLGGVLNALMPGVGFVPVRFAVAGMAGMVAGISGAVLTSIVMVFEMTWDYSTILPVILTAVTAYAVRQRLSPASIYTLKLLRRGHVVPQGLQAWVAGTRRARDIMSTDFVVRHLDQPADARASDRLVAGDADQPADAGKAPANSAAIVVEVRNGEVASVTARDGGSGVVPHVRVALDDHVVTVLRDLARAGGRAALVMKETGSASPGDVVGVITDREIATLARATAHLIE